jgi:hypothetical protein
MIDKSKNLKIILLTATPMVNTANEIIELINLIRPKNDKIKKEDIFTSESNNYLINLKKNGLDILRKMSYGYISHFRGLNPLLFAKQIDMGEIPKGLLFTKLIKCQMLSIQKEAYNNYKIIDTTEDTLDKVSSSIANFVFPVLKQDNISYSYSIEGLNLLIKQLLDNNIKKILLDKIKNKYFKNDNIDDDFLIVENKSVTGNILKLKYLKIFSIKFHQIMININKLKNDKSTTFFVYSNLVKIGIELFKNVLL